MRDFQFYVTDDRYTVPTLLFVQTKNAAAARKMAERMMTNPHYHGIDVWAGDALVFSLDELLTV